MTRVMNKLMILSNGRSMVNGLGQQISFLAKTVIACMYLDWGAIIGDGPGEYPTENQHCIAKNHPKGWQQVQGTVNDGSLEFN
jgi:hypothetical protein